MPKATPTNSSQERSQDSRELLLSVALDLFVQRGYDGASIDDIRQAAGFRSKASLYTHFRSKEDISEALMTRILAQMEQFILQGCKAAASEPLAQFMAAVRSYIQWGLMHRQEYAFRFIRSQQIRMLRGQYDYQSQQSSLTYPMMLDLIHQLRSDYPVRRIADAALISMLMGVISRAVIDRDSFGAVSLSEQVEQVFEMCLGVLFSEPMQIASS